MKEEKQTKMKKSTKYLLIGTLVLFLSILGASMAYYLARISGNLSGRAAGTELDLTITKLSTSATDDLIPLDNDLETLNLASLGYGNEGSTFDASKSCIDINGYSVCQIYRVRLTNNGTVPLTVNGTVEITGANTPNIDCAKMDDEVNITNNASCMGTNTLASNVTLPANNHLDYYVMVYINNLDEPQYDSGEFNGTVIFTTIDGKKVKGRFKHEETVVEKITKLYTDADKTEVTNNEITYNYATSVGLMNDRLGGTTGSLDGGNIRYYGVEPNNYIVIGDKYEEDVIETKGNWEDYVPPGIYSSSEECLEALAKDNVTDAMVEQRFGSSGLTTISQFCSTTTTVVPKDTSILWRIIGVFDGKLRLVRDNPIGAYSWDASEINEWSQSDIMKLLNSGYESEDVGGSLYWNSGSGYCYNNYGNSTTECDFTNKGLSDEAKENIIDQTLYLGGFNTTNVFANQAYVFERGNNVIQNPKDGLPRTIRWTGKVGLIYPSDYGYACDLSNSTDTINVSNYCSDYNWMSKGSSYTVTPNSETSNRVFAKQYAHNSSEIVANGSAIYKPAGIYPVVTLDPELIISSGNGSKDNPYVIEGSTFVPGESEEIYEAYFGR